MKMIHFPSKTGLGLKYHPKDFFQRVRSIGDKLG